MLRLRDGVLSHNVQLSPINYEAVVTPSSEQKKNSLRLSRLSAMFLIQLYAYKVSKIHVYGTLYIYNKPGYVFCFFYILSTYQGCSKVFDHRYFITCNKQGKIGFISTITPHIKLINPLWSKNTPRNMKLHWSASLLEIYGIIELYNPGCLLLKLYQM